ncbi:MAG: FKBP-type peptidyl-prolyl cis-trans isomerase [Bacteroidales bacterium]
MNRIIFLIIFGALFFAGCQKDESKQDEIDRKKILDYIKEHNINALETSSGLFYVIENPGTGGHPNASSTVSVRYTGYFLDGTIFDSNEGKDLVPFSLERVIKGWQEGIPLFQKGGTGKLLIPSRLAYGSNSVGYGIPNNSVLIFDIRLIDFN